MPRTKRALSDLWWWIRYAGCILMLTSRHVDVRLRAYERLAALDEENPRLAALTTTKG